jgi:hypothetical protein
MIEILAEKHLPSLRLADIGGRQYQFPTLNPAERYIGCHQLYLARKNKSILIEWRIEVVPRSRNINGVLIRNP